jgi:hypothetical protein
MPLEERYPPANGHVLIRFATWAYHVRGKSHSVISAALSAVRSFCETTGRDTAVFSDPQVKAHLRALHKQEGARRKRPERYPITIWVLARLSQCVHRYEIILFAAMVVGFHGLFRASEIIAKHSKEPQLLRKHVTLHHDRVVIHLARSKTDTFDEGVDVTLHSTGGLLCPLRWIKRAFEDAPDKCPEAPAFQRSNGKPITYAYFQGFIKRLCLRAGIGSARFSTHSLRIGAASTLIALGFSVDDVKRLGRWKSAAYVGYIRAVSGIHQRVSRSLQQAVVNAGSSPIFCGITLNELAAINSSNIDNLPQMLRVVQLRA